ncbi:MAG: hypothetical protein KAJ39_00520 [Gammaproteobacteria bacterium]|nr:hypothetical protein [Gammaproteobacteria bacterium]
MAGKKPEIHRIRDLITNVKEGMMPSTEYISKPTKLPIDLAPLDSIRRLVAEMYNEVHYTVGLARHLDITPDDINVTHSERFVLEPGEKRTVTVNVERGEILLLKRIVVSDYFKNTYNLQLNGNSIIESSEFDVPSGFLALAENAEIGYIVENNSEHTYDYILQITAWSRRAELWDWSEIEYKEQMEKTASTI